MFVSMLLMLCLFVLFELGLLVATDCIYWIKRLQYLKKDAYHLSVFVIMTKLIHLKWLLKTVKKYTLVKLLKVLIVSVSSVIKSLILGDVDVRAAKPSHAHILQSIFEFEHNKLY